MTFLWMLNLCFILFPNQLLLASCLFTYGGKKRSHFPWRVILCFLVVSCLQCLLSWLAVSQNEYLYISGNLYTICHVCFIFGCLCFLSKTSLKESLFRFVGAYATQSLMYRVGDAISKWANVTVDSSWFTLIMAMSLLVVYTAIFLAVRKRLAKGIVCNGYAIFIIFLFELVLNVYYDGEWLSLVMGIVASLLVLISIFTIEKVDSTQNSLKVLEQVIENENRQQEKKLESIEIINRKCHDLKHQLRAWKEMSKEEQDAYYEEVNKAIDIYDRTVRTGNNVLDALLQEKQLICKEYQITLDYLCDGKVLSFMRVGDIAVLFGNALDNAIEYVKGLDLSQRKIIVKVAKKNNFVCIHFSNPLLEPKEETDGLPKTTKKDEINHGFGLKSIRYIVNSYNGTFTLQTKSDFIINIMIPLEDGSPENMNN